MPLEGRLPRRPSQSVCSASACWRCGGPSVEHGACRIELGSRPSPHLTQPSPLPEGAERVAACPPCASGHSLSPQRGEGWGEGWEQGACFGEPPKPTGQRLGLLIGLADPQLRTPRDRGCSDGSADHQSPGLACARLLGPAGVALAWLDRSLWPLPKRLRSADFQSPLPRLRCRVGGSPASSRRRFDRVGA